MLTMANRPISTRRTLSEPPLITIWRDLNEDGAAGRLTDPQWSTAYEAGNLTEFNSFLSVIVGRTIQDEQLASPQTTYRDIARVRTVNTFNPQEVLEIGGIGEFLMKPIGGRFYDTTLSKILGAQTSIHTAGRVMSVGREAIISDNIDFFTLIPREFSRESGYYRNALVAVGSLSGNPVLADGRNLFNVTDGNLVTTNIQQNVAGGTALRGLYDTALASFKDSKGRRVLGNRPAVVVCSITKEPIIRALLTQATFINGSGFPQDNPAAGLNLRVVAVAELPNDGFVCVMPDQNQFTNIYADFLGGQEEPSIFRELSTMVPVQNAAANVYNFIDHAVRWVAWLDMGSTAVKRTGMAASIPA